MEIKAIHNDKDTIAKIAAIYQVVWDKHEKKMIDRFYQHSTYSGYTGLVLADDAGEMVGFIYGYRSLPGQYYHDLLLDSLQTIGKQAWLNDCFEVVELAILPANQGKGLAKKLLDALITEITAKHSILTTRRTNNRALSLYKQKGWIVLHDAFYPDTDATPYVIMGKESKKES